MRQEMKQSLESLRIEMKQGHEAQLKSKDELIAELKASLAELKADAKTRERHLESVIERKEVSCIKFNAVGK